ncbi:hypothetical protein SPI_06436 [Niveomyces insectorum RCEF 264]|uniref:Uncharacterized protein n=1 Tax=Niveomyces insectorum RCEF 264 TaxID=1081102 RepID=A0A167S4N0_9HYPO|nr:hypothetical protein SPI_06436 [Niveomyces insectorum RCEF 264]
MSGTREDAKTDPTQSVPKRPSSLDRARWKLGDEILEVSKKLNALARLGRSGQWILHHEDLYEHHLDTRPSSRKPDDDVPVRGLTYHGEPVDDWRVIWAGKSPAPDLLDVAFWEHKHKELDEKVKQVEAGLVQHHFTSEELQTLETLEAQKDHIFRNAMNDAKVRAQDCRHAIFNQLFALAQLGRPGQWILHHEDLYHPAIDTRPQTRKAETGIVIRDSIYTGATLSCPIHDDGFLVDLELVWDGKEPPPNFLDDYYWIRKNNDIMDNRHKVENGLVHPCFTPEELQILDAMEAEEEHIFAYSAKYRKENPPVPKVPETPETVLARSKLFDAKLRLGNELAALWECGVAGKWILHMEDLYIPKHDIRRRDHENYATERHGPGVEIPDTDVRYGGRDPKPNFDDVAYWEKKTAELRAKRQDVKAGKVEHNFTAGELLRIKLMEHDAAVARKESRPGRTRRDGVEAWLNSNANGDNAPKNGQAPRPLFPPSSQTDTSSGLDTAWSSNRGWLSRPAAVGADPEQPTGTRQRSTADNGDELHHEESVQPAKRTQGQRPQSPSPRGGRRSSPIRALASSSPAAPAKSKAKKKTNRASGRASKRALATARKGAAVREKPARGPNGAGRPPKTKGASKTKTAVNPRRSARIAALPPRRYK